MKVTCTSCGYTWDYTGKLKYATCPSCRNKTLVASANGEEARASQPDHTREVKREA